MTTTRHERSAPPGTPTPYTLMVVCYCRGCVATPIIVEHHSTLSEAKDRGTFLRDHDGWRVELYRGHIATPGCVLEVDPAQRVATLDECPNAQWRDVEGTSGEANLRPMRG